VTVEEWIHVYAICAGHVPVPEADGLEGARLEARSVDGFTVFISRHARPVVGAEESLVRHAATVDALAATGATILPARFGRPFRDDAALDEAVRARAAAVADALDNVAGCVELGVRVVHANAEPRPADRAKGAAAYMRARLDDVQRLDRLAAEIHEPLAALARDSVRRLRTSGRFELTAAYLVPTPAVDEFRTTFGTLARRHADVAMVCTGPWPPYSFATVGDEAR
jgi:Gas vesicle synthesis protein GvpL/GvpF